MKAFYLILFFSSFCLSCSLETNESHTSFLYERHELLMDYDARYEKNVKQAVIRYFKVLALGSEYGNQISLLKKWVDPMKVYVHGAANDEILDELDLIINELNTLFLNDFYIEKTQDSVHANFYIFLGSASEYAWKYSVDNDLLKSNYGLFSIAFNEDFHITNGHMYVDTDRAPLRIQQHLLREELTQALGLNNDIDYYEESIFYGKPSNTTSYSDLDIEAIRLLYNPSMISRIGSERVQSICENLLGL